jgi:hypothetical protein
MSYCYQVLKMRYQIAKASHGATRGVLHTTPKMMVNTIVLMREQSRHRDTVALL